MSFSSQVGGASLASQPIQIRNGGSGALNWTLTASTFDGGNWLTVSAISGTAPSTVTVGLITQNMPGLGLIAGVYTGQLLFQSGASSVTVPISVEIGANVFVQLAGLSFTKPFGAINPLPQAINVSSTGTAFAFTATGTTATGGVWFSISPSGFCCTTPHSITATVNALATLPSRVYTGQAVFDRGTSAMTVPVILTVTSTLAIVPNVVGLTQAAATASITNAGLVLGLVTTASSNTVPVGSVISESPLAGTQVNTGSAVNLVVSTGPHLILGDFNGSGTPDLVWQNDTTRQVTVHYYGGAQGAVFQGWNWLNSAGIPGWKVVGAADFNGDGVPDLIWQNDATRQATVHYYAGAQGAVFQGWAWLNAGGIPGWKVVGAADFNGDGVPDLIWQNDTTRQVTVHFFGGAQGAVFQGWAWLNAGGIPGWTVAGANDFDKNGAPDLVWQNDATRQVTVHFYNGGLNPLFTGWAYLNGSGIPGWRVIVPR